MSSWISLDSSSRIKANRSLLRSCLDDFIKEISFEMMVPKSHKVLEIASVAIIDRHLPFEYTITSKSTDVMVMALPVQNINHSAFRSMFEREKLSRNNFNDWFRQLKLVLRVEKKMYVIEQPIPPAPTANSATNVLAEWNAIYDAYNEVSCLMLEKEGKLVVAYVLKMKGYVEQLERLGYVLPQDLSVGLILNGLTSDFAGFTRNYNMHNMRKTIGELHAMLIEYEKGLPKKAETPQVMAIRSGKIQKANKKSLKAKGKGKANGKGKDKQVYIPKPKNPKPSAKEHPAKDDTCHHCKEVYDTGCGTHICITKQGLREARMLEQGALYLYVGNGVRAQVEAIRSFDLVLPNGLVICLDNCHYAPTITRGVVSVHRLVENGFIQCFTDYGILVSKNDVLYFNVIPRDGIYEIDMHNLIQNVNSIYNVSNKRVKHNLGSTYLWHCHLAHISKKRIEKLQHDGLLKLMDDESFDECVHVSRQGDSYFITFTDDYSRYDYVYLLKHKHEVFETFKVFKNEVLTPPYTPQHNGVSEMRNRTLLDMVRSMMNLTTQPLSFSNYALESATRILNMVPTKKVDKTPYELWAVDIKEIQEEEDTTPSEITSNIPQEVKSFEPPQSPQEELISIRRSERTHRAPNRLCLNVEAEEHSLGDLGEPANYKTAMLNPESKKSKWIFKKKTDMDGNVHTYKARLVAKGYTQTYLVDYEETLSPVVDIRAIRILISIAALYDYEIWQMDVKTAFLNGYLDVYIYMVQPEGFVDPKHPRKVCKLQRSIYGLKQASRSWNKRFDEEIKRFGFDQNLDEPCVYQKASGSNVTFLILYVDDIIIMGNHIPNLQSVKNYLRKCFSMKDLGEATFILGIKIYRDRS
ncbi:retrotransposon protein, putative, ty1-copia subclass [Tanacetum coccineum]